MVPLAHAYFVDKSLTVKTSTYSIQLVYGAKYLQTQYCGKEFKGYESLLLHLPLWLKSNYTIGVVHIIQKHIITQLKDIADGCNRS